MTKPLARTRSHYAQEAMMLFGRKIRLARIERKLTTVEVAERAGVTRALLHRLENGDPGTSLGAAFEIAAIVGVPLFEDNPHRLGQRLLQVDDKLALLPKSVRKSKSATNDDF